MNEKTLRKKNAIRRKYCAGCVYLKISSVRVQTSKGWKDRRYWGCRWGFDPIKLGTCGCRCPEEEGKND